MAKYNVLFVLGGPGAGKGTQCEKIVEVRCSFLVTSFGFIKESLLPTFCLPFVYLLSSRKLLKPVRLIIPLNL